MNAKDAKAKAKVTTAGIKYNKESISGFILLQAHYRQLANCQQALY